ncbi:uncharacterized protein Dana_GF26294 [Drosophila ananassae]|uniref:Uncharacterized protein n=1 Tax=Drosophila ananassae TaxID=7217 RepID=A0A0P8XZ18_DROAN|nr:uncharacterized protein LOC26513703 [Drosophila ananassae]KPU80123.1 uncharacterized protein Dana_GF26294 [Drosophila ananassae]
MNQYDIRNYENSRVFLTQDDKNHVCTAPGLPKYEIEKKYRHLECPLQKAVKKNYIPSPRPKIVVSCEPSEHEEIFPEDEESTKPVSERSMNLKDILEEVKLIKRRVNRLNHLLKTDVAECPTIKTCYDDLMSQLYEASPLILELQINSHKLDIQLPQLLSARECTEMNLKMNRDALCRDKKIADALLKRLGNLDSFQRTMEKEQALCLERYRHVDREKLDGMEFDRDSEKWERLTAYQILNVANKNNYQKTKRLVFKQINHLKQSSKELHFILIKEMNIARIEVFGLSGSSSGPIEGRDIENASTVLSFKA